jgi:hypothetical protein
MIAGIYTRGEPTANEIFRANTSNRAQMLNADIHPPLSRCICCGKRRNTKTGKFSKAGRFVCHGCRK